MYFVRKFAAFIMRALLWLRYDIRITGTEHLKNKEGVLILPNHPGELDPAIVVSHLWNPLQPHAVAVEDFYYMPGLHYLMRLIRAIPMPNMWGGIGSYKKFRVRKALDHAAECLDEGQNILIYPAGRLMRTTREELRAASGVYDILSRVKQKKILLVRTRGLMGSSFSWLAWQTQPPLIRCLLLGLKHTLMNLLFFSPRRKVEIELFEAPEDFPYDGDKMQMNQYLDDWFNKDGEEQVVLVPQTFWSSKTFQMREPEIIQSVDADIAPEIREKIVNEIAKRRELDSAEIKDAWSLSNQAGFDSLDLAEMVVWMEEEFHTYDVRPEELRTVMDLQVAAAGAARNQLDAAPATPPKGWIESDRRVEVLEPDPDSTVHMNFLKVCDRGGSAVAMADEVSGVLTYKRAKIGVLVLAEIISKYPAKNIGIMLPATGGAALVIMATLVAGKVPVMINWTVGDANIQHVLKVGQVDVILTSSKFLDRLDSINFDQIADYVVTLESLRKDKINLASKLRAAMRARKSAESICKLFGSDHINADEPAVILFTSGSESTPKGVPLSHRNVLSNICGSLDVVGLGASDQLYGFLPPFHSFGFTVTTLLPLTSGLKVAFYPNPTDARALARGASMWNPTIVCGTPTFISGIFRAASDQQLKCLRLIMTAGEKTPAELVESAKKRFNATLLEGYGITECSPVLTICRRDREAIGVGPAVKDVDLQMVHPETRQRVGRGEQGLILAAGPNVFSGYLDRESETAFMDLDDKKYYITGDLGILDDDGSLILTGRMKRFVKVGGEMISLPAMEMVIAKNLPSSEGEVTSALTYVEEAGERPIICLFVTPEIQTDVETVNGFLRDAGLSNLTRIRKVISIEEMPLLGTGKTNYRALTEQLKQVIG